MGTDPDTDGSMNTCLCFPTCQISSGFTDMPLTPIQKHREHSSLFLFLQGETLALIMLRLFTPGLRSCVHRKWFQVC